VNRPDEWGDALEGLKARGLYRRLRETAPLGGMKAAVDGACCVLFSTNNYLGLADHPETVASAVRALQAYGAGAQASRLVSGNFPIHRELEAATASFKGEEACLAFPSGYMANLAAVAALAGEGDAVLCDRLNHASLVDACRASGARLRVFRHRDVADLDRVLARCGPHPRKLVVTDAMFSMDGDLADLPGVMETAARHGARVLVDDAHGTGVLGAGGRGIAHHFKTPNRPDAVVGTYSKALGSVGGFVAGPQPLMEMLVNKARTFIYTTGLPPSACGASLGALAVLNREPGRVDRLWNLSRRLRASLSGAGYELVPGEGPILPVLVGDNEKCLAFSRQLLDKGYFVPAIRPPTVPKGTARLRISVSSSHTDEEVDGLAKAFASL